MEIVLKNEGRCAMVIIDKKVTVSWNYKTKEHYESKGYVFTKFRDKFQVAVEDLSTTSHQKVTVQCDYCERVYQPRYMQIVEGRDTGILKEACADCKHLKQSEVKYGKLITVGNTPEFLESYSNRNTIKPHRLTLSSNQKVWWNCSNGHEYLKSVNKRKEHGCPYCAGSQVLKGYNDLASQRPTVLEYWDYQKNTFKPTEITVGSHKRVHLHCKKCKGKWNLKAQDSTKANNKVYCPYCNNRRVLLGFNDFATKYPTLSKEWSHKNKIKPSEVTCTYYKNVWWKCSVCHLDFKTPLNARVRQKSSCPYCADKKVHTGYNDITITKPLGIKDWSKRNKSEPNKFTRLSDKKVWWDCVVCGHQWKEMIKTKLSRKIGCTKCSLSSGGRQVKKVLLDMNVIIETEYSFQELKGTGGNSLRFDFAILSTNKDVLGIIEYDGGQHFQSVKYYGGDKTLVKIQKHDTLKNEYCIENDIPLLRIRYSISESELIQAVKDFVKDITEEEHNEQSKR